MGQYCTIDGLLYPMPRESFERKTVIYHETRLLEPVTLYHLVEIIEEKSYSACDTFCFPILFHPSLYRIRKCVSHSYLATKSSERLPSPKSDGTATTFTPSSNNSSVRTTDDVCAVNHIDQWKRTHLSSMGPIAKKGKHNIS